MKWSKYWLLKTCFGLGLAGGAWRIGGHRSLGGDAVDLRSLVEWYQRRQAEMLRMNWGKPGFCTEMSFDYEPKTMRCRGGGRLYRRR